MLLPPQPDAPIAFATSRHLGKPSRPGDLRTPATRNLRRRRQIPNWPRKQRGAEAKWCPAHSARIESAGMGRASQRNPHCRHGGSSWACRMPTQRGRLARREARTAAPGFARSPGRLWAGSRIDRRVGDAPPGPRAHPRQPDPGLMLRLTPRPAPDRPLGRPPLWFSGWFSGWVFGMPPGKVFEVVFGSGFWFSGVPV